MYYYIIDITHTHTHTHIYIYYIYCNLIHEIDESSKNKI